MPKRKANHEVYEQELVNVSDEEFIGLENFQGQKDSDDDSQEEVFGLQGVDSDEEIPDSDDQDDDLSEDDDIAQDEALLEKLKAQLARPDTTLSSDDEGDQDMDMEEAEGGWGKKKRAYYNADDSDEDAEEEENEALRLQKEQLASLQDNDFFDDSFEAQLKKQSSSSTATSALVETTSFGAEHISRNLEDMSPEEIDNAFRLSNPKLYALIKSCEREVLSRNMSDALSAQQKLTYSLAMMNVSYCCSYALSGASSGMVSTHPAYELAQSLISQIKSMPETGISETRPQKQLKRKVESILANEDQDEALENNVQEESDAEVEEYLASVQRLQQQKSSMKRQKQSEYTEGVTAYRDQAARLDEDIVADDKRKATWNILTNRGLTPHRKKIDRNPRVKKRVKYEKAKKKLSSVRRLAVDKTKLGRYEGEKTGIKANLTRSVRF